MIKSVFKEIIIILLLVFAILALLGVLFYDYIPNKETLPEKAEEYKLADDVKDELEKELNNVNSDEIIKTYQLDATELEHYEKIKEYNKGKVNPFAQYSSGTANTNNSGQQGSGNAGSTSSVSSSSNSSSGNNSTSNNNSSTGTFLNTVGK